MIRLVYLPVNQVYVFRFGDGLVQLYLPENLEPAPLFFRTLDEAIRTATLCRLAVGQDEVVTAGKKVEIKVLARPYYDPFQRAQTYRFEKDGKIYETVVGDDVSLGLTPEEIKDYVFTHGKEIKP